MKTGIMLPQMEEWPEVERPGTDSSHVPSERAWPC